jgi:hypothetical protein
MRSREIDAIHPSERDGMLARMKQERRQTQRYRVSGPAKIRSSAGALPRDC